MNVFQPPISIEELGKLATDVLSLGNQTGEGWYLTAEMIELILTGAQKYSLYAAFCMFT